ncbi:MAG: hypothetical protein Ct9H300mP25_04300 [Acidobacteriota bacterium]|nr:MAG: hypothetical protein Ct9H300mP25_04300 [Acidobacteriota bacterium]
MQKNLQWKLLSIVAITAIAAWAVYPPEDRIRLGLDLEGGVHMVLRVQTDDALQVETEMAAEQLSEQLSLQGVTTVTLIPVDANHHTCRGCGNGPRRRVSAISR